MNFLPLYMKKMCEAKKIEGGVARRRRKFWVDDGEISRILGELTFEKGELAFGWKTDGELTFHMGN